MAIALFPGQGVQAPGMQGGLLEVSRDVFETSARVVGVDIADLCSTGRSGAADLTSTRWAQPAVLTCSVASFRALGRSFDALAGHSVGEYAALVCSGALELADALRLIALRAEVTSEAAAAEPGAMAAVIRAEPDLVDEVCDAAGVVVAADNAAGQMVISGPAGGIEEAIGLLSQRRAVCRRLEVDGAFHSPLMAPAAAALSAELERTPVEAPSSEFWSSTTATVLADPDAIRAALVDQLTAPVRWRETVAAMGASHDGEVVDLGPGRVVGGLARRILDGRDVVYADEVLAVAR